MIWRWFGKWLLKTLREIHWTAPRNPQHMIWYGVVKGEVRYVITRVIVEGDAGPEVEYHATYTFVSMGRDHPIKVEGMIHMHSHLAVAMEACSKHHMQQVLGYFNTGTPYG